MFGGSPAKPTQHLGESQTCHVIVAWTEFAGSTWISDDRDSLDYASARGIPAWNTLEIMRALVSDGDLTAQQAYDLMLDMADADRGLLLPETLRDLS